MLYWIINTRQQNDWTGTDLFQSCTNNLKRLCQAHLGYGMENGQKTGQLKKNSTDVCKVHGVCTNKCIKYATDRTVT